MSGSDQLAIIGGGRWARQIAGILSSAGLTNSKITLCSPGHTSGWQQWLSQCNTNERDRFQIADFNDVLWDHQIGRVFVARAARDNGPTAIAALAHNKAVFVEKPFAISPLEGRLVVDAARGKVCLTGLVFLFASNLHRFKEALSSLSPVKEINIVWADRKAEQRHGESKSYDPSVNLVVDVMPHVWSLLQILVPNSEMHLIATTSEAGGRVCKLDISCAGAIVKVLMVRDAPRRIRQITVRGQGRCAAMDFSQEPGSADIDGQKIDVSQHFASPLRAEIENFLGTSARDSALALNSVQKSIASLEISDLALRAIRPAQVVEMAAGLFTDASGDAREAASYALREIVASAAGARRQDALLPLVDEATAWLGGKTKQPSVGSLKASRWLNEVRVRLEEISK